VDGRSADALVSYDVRVLPADFIDLRGSGYNLLDVAVSLRHEDGLVLVVQGFHRVRLGVLILVAAGGERDVLEVFSSLESNAFLRIEICATVLYVIVAEVASQKLRDFRRGALDFTLASSAQLEV